MVDENALRNSFRAIKADMLKIEGELLSLQEQQGMILLALEKLSAKPKKKKAVKKKVKKKTKKKAIKRKTKKKILGI